MKEKKTLLQRARVDIEITKENIQKKDDEIYIDIAAYHIQQAIEKILKYLIEMEGESYRKTHDISILWGDVDELGLSPPEWIWENRDKLNRYQTETRYGDDIVASRREIIEILEKTSVYYDEVLNKTQTKLNPNGVSEKFDM